MQTAFLIRIISVILQYGVLLLLFIFIFKIVKFMRQDIRKSVEPVHHETAAAEAVLTVVQAQDAALVGRRFAFTEAISIGRSDDNDIVLRDTFVSHHHALITRLNNLFVIEDLGSSNHTYVNDECLLEKKYLQENDCIRIGGVSLKFER